MMEPKGGITPREIKALHDYLAEEAELEDRSFELDIRDDLFRRMDIEEKRLDLQLRQTKFKNQLSDLRIKLLNSDLSDDEIRCSASNYTNSKRQIMPTVF